MRSRPSLLPDLLVGLAMPDRPCACQRHHPSADSASGVSETAGTVRFDLYQGYFIVVHGSDWPAEESQLLPGHRHNPLRFRFADRQKARSPRRRIYQHCGSGRQSGGRRGNLPSLEIGPLKRSNLHVVTADLSFFQKFFPVRIDAIVGLDVLGQATFRHRLLRPRHSLWSAPALPVSVPLRLDRGLAVFDAEIDHTPVHLLFDTGASSLILFNRVTPKSPGVKADAVLRPEAIGDFESKQVRLQYAQAGPGGVPPKTGARDPQP